MTSSNQSQLAIFNNICDVLGKEVRGTNIQNQELKRIMASISTYSQMAAGTWADVAVYVHLFDAGRRLIDGITGRGIQTNPS